MAIIVLNYNPSFRLFLAIYLILFLITKFSYQRADLLIFFFLNFLMIINLKLNFRKTLILILTHILLYVIFFENNIREFHNYTFLSKNVIFENLHKKELDTNFDGDVNSTLTRIKQINLSFKIYKDNIIIGAGYTKINQPYLQDGIQDGGCECAILYPLFSYGLISLIILIVLFIILLKFSIKKNSINLFIQTSLLSLGYLSLFSNIPAWIGLFVFVIQSSKLVKNLKHEV